MCDRPQVRLRYAVVFEQMTNNYGAYAPDVPGCVSTGKNWEEIQANIRQARPTLKVRWAKFWRQVSSALPDAQERRRRLREAGRMLPL